MSKLAGSKGLVSAPGDDERWSFRPSCFSFICNMLTDRRLSRLWKPSTPNAEHPWLGNTTPFNYCCSNKYNCYIADIHCHLLDHTKQVKTAVIQLSVPSHPSSSCHGHPCTSSISTDSSLQYPSTRYSDFQQKYIQQGEKLHYINWDL